MFCDQRTSFVWYGLFNFCWDLLVGLELWPIFVCSSCALARNVYSLIVGSSVLFLIQKRRPVHCVVQIISLCARILPLPSRAPLHISSSCLVHQQAACVICSKDALAPWLPWAHPMGDWKVIEKKVRVLIHPAPSCQAIWAKTAMPCPRPLSWCAPSPSAAALPVFGVGDHSLVWVLGAPVASSGCVSPAVLS